MTTDEYLSPARFPLTSQHGLNPNEQFEIDPFDLAELRALQNGGHTLSRDEQARLAEMEK